MNVDSVAAQDVSGSIEASRQRRQRTWQFVSRISGIADRTGVAPPQVSTRTLFALPDWCQSDLWQIRVLQRHCGAMYFAPTIYQSIDGSMLREFGRFVGRPCFDYLRETSRFEHEVAQPLIPAKLQVSVMAAGSSVLLSTLTEPAYVRCFEAHIGPASVTVDAQLGQTLLAAAQSLSTDSASAGTR
jgi:hypothetical protein